MVKVSQSEDKTNDVNSGHYVYLVALLHCIRAANTLFSQSWTDESVLYVTIISGPYGPSILALAESWGASHTSCLAMLDLSMGALPHNHIFQKRDIQSHGNEDTNGHTRTN